MNAAISDRCSKNEEVLEEYNKKWPFWGGILYRCYIRKPVVELSEWRNYSKAGFFRLSMREDYCGTSIALNLWSKVFFGVNLVKDFMRQRDGRL